MNLKDLSPVNAAMHDHARAAAIEDYRYQVQRRDQITDKIRFGLVALNGASLLALLSALGGTGQAAKWLGFSQENALLAAICFAVGLILAGFSVVAQQNVSIREAGDASAQALTLSRLVASYEDETTAENHESYGKILEEYHKLPLTGFQYSVAAISAQNFSAGAWLLGIVAPLASVVEPTIAKLW